MRGVIFRAFSSFIENKFDYETLDELLEDGNYPNKGGFSIAGKYEVAYLVSMVEYSRKFYQNSAQKVYFAFGEYAFGYLMKKFKSIYDGMYTPLHARNAYAFLKSLNILHNDELKKLYPDATFPKFEITTISKNHLIIEYCSHLNAPHFVHGLIVGCLKYYGDNSSVSWSTLEEKRIIKEKLCEVHRFEVKK